MSVGYLPTWYACGRQSAKSSCFMDFHCSKGASMSLQKPQKLRQLLQQYGTVGRLYCAPEGDEHLLPKHTSLLLYGG